LNVTVSTLPTKTGKTYQSADVAYKNLTFQGKVEGKKLASFGAQEGSFKVASTAQPGDVFEVEVVKNAAGYNDWVSMQKAGATTAGTVNTSVPAGVPARAGATAAPRSTYETPEERAKKQVYIVRQSSVSSAISLHSVGAKTLDLDKVLDTARKVEAYVLGTGANTGGATGFDDLPDVPDEFVDADGNPRIT
jgi:hypothetical protein